MKKLLIALVLLLLLGLYQTYTPKDNKKIERTIEQIEENIGDNFAQ